MPTPKLPVGRVLPPQFKHVIDQPFSVRFTWKQRLLIALGCPVVGKFVCWTEHSPGKVHPLMEFHTNESARASKVEYPVIQPSKE